MFTEVFGDGTYLVVAAHTPATSRPHSDRHSKLLCLHLITQYHILLTLCALFQHAGYPKRVLYASTPPTNAYSDTNRTEFMLVVLQVPSRLAPRRSWPRWRLLSCTGSLVILSAYPFEYAYLALIFHSIFMIIFTATLNLISVIPAPAQCALVGPATAMYLLNAHQILRLRLLYVSINAWNGSRASPTLQSATKSFGAPFSALATNIGFGIKELPWRWYTGTAL